MNLQVIAEHTVDLDLLPKEGAVIIDIGCRGFGFTKYFDNDHVVYAVDIDHLPDSGRYYERIAITGNNGRVGVKRTTDPQATHVTEGDELESCTLESFISEYETGFPDIVKLDCEGSEKEIILSLTQAPAKQLSIEFHLHTGVYSQPEVALMVAKLKSLGYKTVQHNLENRHGAGFNYWDSLFVLE